MSVTKTFIITTILFTGLIFVGLYHDFNLSGQSTIDPQHLSDQYDPEAKIAIFHGKQIPISNISDDLKTKKAVLGQTAASKTIEINLTTQQLFAYEGSTLIYTFPISSGKWYKTPTGTFYIWTKIRYTKMEGGSKLLNTYYNLPNVPYVMYFANDEIPQWRGFGIHGAYWHNNFGHPMSHGCINLKVSDAAQLYYWVMPDLYGKSSIIATEDNPGTPIIIYGTTPI